MAGLVGVPARKRAGCPAPAIHVLRALRGCKDVDDRDKRGYDGESPKINNQCAGLGLGSAPTCCFALST
jgi:hypothetical protein